MPNRFSEYMENVERLRHRAMRGESDGYDPARNTLNGVPREMAHAAIAIDPATPTPRSLQLGDMVHVALPPQYVQHNPPIVPPLPMPTREYYERSQAEYLRRFMEMRDYSAFSGIDWSGGAPSRSTTRPPATPPTSTTTIGEPAAVDADYAALVAELGINCAAVDLERFKALVPELGLHVYARAEVQEYLHSLYKVPVGDLTPTVVWGWRPLREKDRSALGQVQYNGRVQRSAPIYSKPIPYPVLRTVKAVRDACPSATFYVSDEMHAEAIPDPFLLVIVAGQEFVIERWDEPAFRAKP